MEIDIYQILFICTILTGLFALDEAACARRRRDIEMKEAERRKHLG